MDVLMNEAPQQLPTADELVASFQNLDQTRAVLAAVVAAAHLASATQARQLAKRTASCLVARPELLAECCAALWALMSVADVKVAKKAARGAAAAADACSCLAAGLLDAREPVRCNARGVLQLVTNADARRALQAGLPAKVVAVMEAAAGDAPTQAAACVLLCEMGCVDLASVQAHNAAAAVCRAMEAHRGCRVVQMRGCCALRVLKPGLQSAQVKQAAHCAAQAVLAHAEDAEVRVHAGAALCNLADKCAQGAVAGGAVLVATAELARHVLLPEAAGFAMETLRSVVRELPVVGLPVLPVVAVAMLGAPLARQLQVDGCRVLARCVAQAKDAALLPPQVREALCAAMGTFPDCAELQVEACAAVQHVPRTAQDIQLVTTALVRHHHDVKVQRAACAAIKRFPWAACCAGRAQGDGPAPGGGSLDPGDATVLSAWQAVITAMHRHRECEALQASACRALRSLSANHALRRMGMMPSGAAAACAALMAFPTSTAVVRSALHALDALTPAEWDLVLHEAPALLAVQAVKSLRDTADVQQRGCALLCRAARAAVLSAELQASVVECAVGALLRHAGTAAVASAACSLVLALVAAGAGPGFVDWHVLKALVHVMGIHCKERSVQLVGLQLMRRLLKVGHVAALPEDAAAAAQNAVGQFPDLENEFRLG